MPAGRTVLECDFLRKNPLLQMLIISCIMGPCETRVRSASSKQDGAECREACILDRALLNAELKQPRVVTATDVNVQD
jgi:hypothetical protein